MIELEKYFLEKKLLYNNIGFINFIVGKKEHRIDFKNKINCGVTFEVPRNSLLLSIRYKIFDDLLIGNFMKTTLHNMQSLYDYEHIAKSNLFKLNCKYINFLLFYY